MAMHNAYLFYCHGLPLHGLYSVGVGGRDVLNP